jgi:hypothetical protein
LAGLRPRPFIYFGQQARVGIKLAKYSSNNWQSRNDKAILRDEPRDRGALGVSAKQSRGHVVRRAVFGERTPD